MTKQEALRLKVGDVVYLGRVNRGGTDLGRECVIIDPLDKTKPGLHIWVTPKDGGKFFEVKPDENDTIREVSYRRISLSPIDPFRVRFTNNGSDGHQLSDEQYDLLCSAVANYIESFSVPGMKVVFSGRHTTTCNTGSFSIKMEGSVRPECDSDDSTD